LKKEPDPVTEKKAGGSSKYDKFGDRLRVLIVTLEKERTKLRDEKFEVISKDTREVRVHSAFFQLFNCVDFVGV